MYLHKAHLPIRKDNVILEAITFDLDFKGTTFQQIAQHWVLGLLNKETLNKSFWN